MSAKDIDKAYISPHDRFLIEFDRKHTLTPSQLQEIKKHERIFYLRDHAQKTDAKGEIWSEF